MLSSRHWGKPIEIGVDYRVYLDPYPVTDGHIVFEADTETALIKCFSLARQHGMELVQLGKADGYNIGMDCGEVAGQLVDGTVIHLIPRQRHDSNNPAGGIRKVIDGQGDFTIPYYQHPSRDVSAEITEKFNYIHYEKYNQLFGPGSVPGYLTSGDIIAINEICEMLPNDSLIVELGSFLGKSAAEWAKNLILQNKKGKIVCIDTFNSAPETLEKLLKKANFPSPGKKMNQIEMFEYYTKDWPNIHKIKSHFDKNFVWNDSLVNCFFEDSDHTTQTLSIGLPFWWDQLTTNGILCGHDYGLDEGVSSSVNKFAQEKNINVKQFQNSSIWMMIKD